MGKKGQGLVEYLLLVAILSISSIWVLRSLSKNLQEHYANISNTLAGRQGVKATPADRSRIKARGTGDYFEGAEVEE